MDVLTKEQRRKNMQAIKSKDTKIEKILGKALWAKGLRYRKNNKKVFGKPDFTFCKYKVAVFCDGDFFHGKDWDKAKKRIKTNRSFWHNKIEANISRDKEVNRKLCSEGWIVLRFWESDIKKNLQSCVEEVEKAIESREESEAVTYSWVREKLGLNTRKPKVNDGLAAVTHYLQTSSPHFEEQAREYLSSQGIPLPLDTSVRYDIPFPPPPDPDFRFIDLFAGIGGFRMALQNLGGSCVFSSEWNKFAQQTYEANYGELPFGDITKVDAENIPDHDLLVAGFPCQPFSIAGVSKKKSLGKEHGFKDEAQGTLFFDIVRILDAKRPKVFLLENVKNLVSHDKRRTFKVISGALKELGYTIHFQVLDGKHFVPQHRERIFIVGFDESAFTTMPSFSFPELPVADHRVKDILEEEVEAKYTLSDKLWNYLQEYAKKHKAKGNGFGFGLADMDKITRTLSARYYKDGSEILIPQEEKQNPRRLTPRECARLQGYPDEFIIPVSDNQAYRQFGNSVVQPLVEYLGKSIVEFL